MALYDEEAPADTSDAYSRALRQTFPYQAGGYLKGALKRGAGVINEAAGKLPRFIPGVGLAQDMSAMMAPDQLPAAAQAPYATPAMAQMYPPYQPPAGLPPAAAAPAPTPMPVQAQRAPAAPAPARTAAAGGTAAPAPGAPAVAAVNTGNPEEDARIRQAQEALDEYYSGVIGTGAAERRAARLAALSQSLRMDSTAKDSGTQVGRGLKGIARGILDYKSYKEDQEREKKLDQYRTEYLRNRRGESNAPIGTVTEKDFGG